MITIYDWFGYELPIKQRYQLIKEAGFDGVLAWWSNHLNRNDYRGGPQIIRETGLFIENIHTPFQIQNDLWLDNLQGQAAVDCYSQCVADCAEFQIPTMVVHLPEEDNPYNALGMDRLKRIVQKAEKLEVNVALENLWNLNNLSYVLQHIDSPRIGFCYDCAHHYRYYPDTSLLSTYGNRLMALHLHDNYGDMPHCLPFDGTIDWVKAMKNIAETGYTGPTAIEVMNWKYQNLSAEEFLHQAYQRAKRLESFRI